MNSLEKKLRYLQSHSIKVPKEYNEALRDRMTERIHGALKYKARYDKKHNENYQRF